MNAPIDSTTRSKTRWAVVLACTLVAVSEGIDIVVYGVSIPLFIEDGALEINQGTAGHIGSLTFLGMLIGGVSAGKICQKAQLRTIILTGFIAFTVLTALVAASQATWQLGTLRFLAGLGLGVVLPATLSLARQYTAAKDSALAISVVMAGIPIGGTVATLLAQVVSRFSSWHLLFACSAVVGLVLFVAIWTILPRSESADGGSPENAAPWSSLFRRRTLPILLFGIVATLFDLLAFYGVSTWLTQLMREFGVPLNSSLQITLVLNIGSIFGMIVAGAVAVRLGTRRIAAFAGLISAAGLFAIASQTLSSVLLLIVVALVGISTNTAQTLVNTLVGDSFSPSQRSAALGMTLGMGRLGAVIAPTLGGTILSAGLGASWVLVSFGVAALIGMAALLGFNRRLIEQARDNDEVADEPVQDLSHQS